MRRRTCRLAHLSLSFILLAIAAPPAFATDHFNLESGIPTTLEDIEPVERGSFELQGFGRYLRLKGDKNVGETEPRLAWGIFEKTQVEISTPLLLGEGLASGNGDVQVSILRKLWGDQQERWKHLKDRCFIKYTHKKHPIRGNCSQCSNFSKWRNFRSGINP